jgi:DNA-binding transcriptional regulator YiaG
VFLPGTPIAYIFPILLNRRELDPISSRNSQTSGKYTRKYRKDKRLLIKDLAEELGVSGDTLISWEVKGKGAHRKKHKGPLQQPSKQPNRS